MKKQLQEIAERMLCGITGIVLSISLRQRMTGHHFIPVYNGKFLLLEQCEFCSKKRRKHL
jgi:hypothetical protein